jgi:hypothetical protein
MNCGACGHDNPDRAKFCEELYSPVADAKGRVNVVCTSGANSEGGAVESFFVALIFYRDGKLARMEMFEVEQLDAAVARFEELSREGEA